MKRDHFEKTTNKNANIKSIPLFFSWKLLTLDKLP